MPVTGWGWTNQLVRERDVASGRDDVRVVGADFADVRAVRETLERVGAQQDEREFRREIVPEVLETLGAVRIARLPQQIDHLTVHPHRSALAGGCLEPRRDGPLEPDRIGHIVDHDSGERLGSARDDEVVGPLERRDVEASRGQQSVDTRCVKRRGHDHRRLTGVETFCKEVGNDLTKPIGVVIEADGVEEPLAVHHFLVSRNCIHGVATVTAV